MLLPHNQLKALDKKRTEIQNMSKFWCSFWGPFLGPKMGPGLAALLRILLKPELEAPFWGLFWDPKLEPKLDSKTPKKSAENSEKSDQGGSRDSEKVMQKPAKTLGTHCKSNRMLPPSADHLQRALATSTGCVYVMRHALHMI